MNGSAKVLMNLGTDSCKKKLAKRREVFLAIKMLQHPLLGSAAQIAKGCQGPVNQLNVSDEIFQRTRRIKKTVLAVCHQFRNACDRRREHGFTANHCLHELSLIHI